MIFSIKQAFKILDTQKDGIPYEAIDYLRNAPTSPKIVDKIYSALIHAYDDTYHDHNSDFWYNTPLWYAIVAEKHLSKKLITPVAELFTTTEDDWDFLDEQGQFLICLLAEKYPDDVIRKLRELIDALLKLKAQLPYLYLFDAFYFVDKEKYKDFFLQILNDERLFWKEALAETIADLQIKEALPMLRKMLKEADEFDRAGVKESIIQLETGKLLYPEMSGPYSKERGDWKKHYKTFEDNFYSHDTDEIVEVSSIPKVRRNELCFCGSGKKYKKCCLLKIN